MEPTLSLMNLPYEKFVLSFLMLAWTTVLQAQTTVTGTINDDATRKPLAGANILIKGSATGAISGADGKYALKTDQLPPFTLIFSFVGFATKEVVVSGNSATVDVAMEGVALLGQEVVVSASRMPESIMKSPVTIEAMDILSIKQAATPDYFDAIANMKGVQVTSPSLTFTSVNARGFADTGNTRFVQLIDDMDAADPVIGFPVGSIQAPGELDAESLELIPGAASAL
jgi:hypothetical protein